MKKFVILFSWAMIECACSTNKLPRFDYNNGPNPWINAFKDRVFINCLYQSYPAGVRDSIFQLMARYDLFNPYDDINVYASNNKKLLDSLGGSIPKNLPAYWHADEADLKGKNVYMCSCLHYYSSKELNSVARGEYKKFRKANDKTGSK
jgi:hypothetical protein